MRFQIIENKSGCHCCKNYMVIDTSDSGDNEVCHCDCEDWAKTIVKLLEEADV